MVFSHRAHSTILQTFLTAANLRDPFLTEARPWAFAPGAGRVEEMRGLPKSNRRTLLLDAATPWQVYTTVRGATPTRRVARDNPAAAVLGLAADYDMRTDWPEIEKWLRQMPVEFQPQFVEFSLSNNVRLVWVFERPLLVRDSEHAAALSATVFDKLKARTLLPGYDDASERPEQMWTNGADWRAWREEPLAWALVLGFAVDAAKHLPTASGEIDLDAVAAEVAKRWPGRWQGDFKLNALGVRFWDETADNANGCQVKPDGMLCFTGATGFVPWAQLLGGAWVAEQRALNLGRIAGETYFDGRTYYQRKGGHWFDMCREDIMLDLGCRGVNMVKGKGQNVSDASRVMHFIQNGNRIHGAAPLIFMPPGTVEVNGWRILNTSTLRPTEPVAQTCTLAAFPLLWKILSGLFVPRAGLLPLDTFLAWTRRAYISIRERRPEMGQAMFFCGPVSNGKTLICAHVLKPAFGGRMANPYKYFVGETDFTDDLFGAALWAINDEESPDEKGKGKMLSKIKSSVVNPEQTFHPKFCKKLSLPWQGRIFCTLNDDALSTGQLPEVNEATRDKMMFFATQAFAGEWPDRTTLEARIAVELPFFLRWLLDWTPPEAILGTGRESRMGIKSYFDPHILSLSHQQAYSYNFRELLAVWVPLAPEFNDAEEWCGSPTRLFATIGNNPSLVPLLRDWTVAKVAKSLTALARVPGTGVTFGEGTQREFTVTRQAFLPTTLLLACP